MINSFFACQQVKDNNLLSDSEKTNLLTTLKKDVSFLKEWQKVHAAEYLIDLNETEQLQDIFLDENKEFGNNIPYRIGIWRVLTRLSDSDSEREKWINKILYAFGDTIASDSTHAAETLAKLSVSPYHKFPERTLKVLEETDSPFSIYTRWAVLSASQRDLIDSNYFYYKLMDEIPDKIDPLLNISAYAFKFLNNVTDADWRKLANKVINRNKESHKNNVYVMSSLFVTAPESVLGTEVFKEVRNKLLSFIQSDNNGVFIEVMNALAAKGTAEDLKALLSHAKSQNMDFQNLDNEFDADHRDAIAYAILRINKRVKLLHM